MIFINTTYLFRSQSRIENYLIFYLNETITGSFEPGCKNLEDSGSGSISTPKAIGVLTGVTDTSVFNSPLPILVLFVKNKVVFFELYQFLT